jgi:hypothetical protein
LRSIHLRLFDRYVEWLFGPKVWANATRSLEGQVLSTPTITMVISYEWQVRKSIVALLNTGVDYASALAQVKKDDRHFQTHFLNHVAKSKETSVSAPGLRASMSNPVVARPIRDHTAGTVAAPTGTKVKDTKSKNARARANKKQALADARASAQVQPRGQQRAILDRSTASQGAGRDNKKGKGKGKGKIDLPPGARLTSGTGQNICKFFNTSAGCSHSPCSYARISWLCDISSHAGSNHV